MGNTAYFMCTSHLLPAGLQIPAAALFILFNAAQPSSRCLQGPPVPTVICKFSATETPAMFHPRSNNSVSIWEGACSLGPIITEHKSAFFSASPPPSFPNNQERGHQGLLPSSPRPGKWPNSRISVVESGPGSAETAWDCLPWDCLCFAYRRTSIKVG